MCHESVQVAILRNYAFCAENALALRAHSVEVYFGLVQNMGDAISSIHAAQLDFSSSNLLVLFSGLLGFFIVFSNILREARPFHKALKG